MLSLLDNDVVHKAALFDLLEPLSDATQELGGYQILDTFRFRYQLDHPSKALKKCKTLHAVNRLKSFCAQAPHVPMFNPPSLYAAIAGIPGVDEGEIRLLVAARQQPGALIISGDKRFIEVLGNAPALEEYRKALASRVLCLEQVVRKMISVHGFETVRDRIVPALEHDTAMRAVFGSAAESTAGSVAEGLNAYEADLRKKAGGVLAPGWPLTSA